MRPQPHLIPNPALAEFFCLRTTVANLLDKSSGAWTWSERLSHRQPNVVHLLMPWPIRDRVLDVALDICLANALLVTMQEQKQTELAR